MTFDLTTGTGADWPAVLPKALLAPAAEGYDPTDPHRSVALRVAPNNLADAKTACAEAACLPVARLRALGADPRLMAALLTGQYHKRR